MALSLETELGASYRLDESLMERMMLPSTAGTQPIASSRLSIQRRMHPEIADLMRATLYPYLEVSYSLPMATRRTLTVVDVGPPVDLESYRSSCNGRSCLVARSSNARRRARPSLTHGEVIFQHI